MEKISKRYISLSDFNLPPQTSLYGIIFDRMTRCNIKSSESNDKRPTCAIVVIIPKSIHASIENCNITLHVQHAGVNINGKNCPSIFWPFFIGGTPVSK